jgi:hypothetical protein
MVSSNTFFYALIIVAGLVVLFLFLKRGQTCTSCSEGFKQKSQQSIKESEYRREKRNKSGAYHDYVPATETNNKHYDFKSDYSQPWPGYNKYSLYSPHVSPPNTDNYPYMDSPYNQVMTPCAMGCTDKKCLSGCVFHALAETLAPVQ